MLSFTFPNVICLQWHSVFGAIRRGDDDDDKRTIWWCALNREPFVSHMQFHTAACMYRLLRCVSTSFRIFPFHVQVFCSVRSCFRFCLMFQLPAHTQCMLLSNHRVNIYYNKFEYCVVIGRDFNVCASAEWSLSSSGYGRLAPKHVKGKLMLIRLLLFFENLAPSDWHAVSVSVWLSIFLSNPINFSFQRFTKHEKLHKLKNLELTTMPNTA